MRVANDLLFYTTVALWGIVIAWLLGAAVWLAARVGGAL